MHFTSFLVKVRESVRIYQSYLFWRTKTYHSKVISAERRAAASFIMQTNSLAFFHALSLPLGSVDVDLPPFNFFKPWDNKSHFLPLQLLPMHPPALKPQAVTVDLTHRQRASSTHSAPSGSRNSSFRGGHQLPEAAGYRPPFERATWLLAKQRRLRLRALTHLAC